MTAKEKLLEKYPKAYAEKFKTHGGESYWLVWGQWYQKQRLGEGKTKIQALTNAWKNVEKGFTQK